MVEPIAMAALTWMLNSVGQGMAGEVGRRGAEQLGAVVARITGRHVPAPTTNAERDALARVLHEAARRDPAHARSLAAVLDLLGTALPGPRTGHHPPPLPPGVRSFTDRKEALRLLTREATRAAHGRPRQVLVYGPEGIGTSALAVQWAREHKADFPDGALLADLRGEAPGHGCDPRVALRILLCRLGLTEEELPGSTEARSETYRRLTEDLRMVVILDHAQGHAQVRPLLTGAPGVFTIICARHPLPGLDAVPVPVGPLPDRDAMRLLKALAGKAAVAGARERLPALLSRCAGSPYALQAAAHDLCARAHASLTGWETAGPAPDPQGPARTVEDPAPAVEHRPVGLRPDAATGVPQPPDGPSAHGSGPASQGETMLQDPVHGLAEDAYARLPEDAARCYRLWALRPWDPLLPPAAAVIAGIPEEQAATLLADLAQRSLLEPVAGGGHRYREGVRRHAEAAAVREDGLAACARAVQRGVAHHVDVAVHAARAALPKRWPLGARYAAADPDRHPSTAAALTVLVAALGNLTEAARAAEEFEDWDTVLELAEASWPAQLKAGREDQVLPLLRIAARVAGVHRPETRMAGRIHAQLGLALLELSEHAAAEDALRAAAEADRDADHLRGQATAVESLGLLRLRQWRWQEAYDCFAEAGALWDRVGPGDEGFDDLTRARALLHRHSGRALRGLGDLTAALAQSHTALATFRAIDDVYNAARTLTDIAETQLKAGAPEAALPLIDEALPLLAAEGAVPHVRYLRTLRDQCTGDLTPED